MRKRNCQSIHASEYSYHNLSSHNATSHHITSIYHLTPHHSSHHITSLITSNHIIHHIKPHHMTYHVTLRPYCRRRRRPATEPVRLRRPPLMTERSARTKTVGQDEAAIGVSFGGTPAAHFRPARPQLERAARPICRADRAGRPSVPTAGL